MAKGLGQQWTERLQRADAARDWWRPIVWQSREHYDGITMRGQGKPVPYNKHRAAEDNVRAALQPDSVAVRLNALLAEDKGAARANQILVNWALRASRFVGTTNPFITHARTDGVGIYKVEWGGAWQPRVQAGDEGNIAVPGNPTERSKKDRTQDQLAALEKVFPSDMRNKELPQAHIIDPMDFLMDAAVSKLDDSCFVAHRVWVPKRHIELLQEAGYYKNIKLNYDPSLPSTQERWERQKARQVSKDTRSGRRTKGSRGRGRDIREDEELWEVWEVHDRENGRVLHIIPGTNGALRDVPAEVDGMPYITFRPTATPWSFWPIPDVFQYMSAQNTLDTLLSMIVQHISMFAKTLVFTSEELDENAKNAIAEAINGEVISVSDVEAIKTQHMGSLHPDLMNVLNLLSQVIHEISGVSQMAVGVPSGNTATEVNQIGQFQSVRMRRMSIDLNDAFMQVAQRYLGLLRDFAIGDITVPVLGEDAIEFDIKRKEGFETIKKADMAIDFEFEVKVGAGAQIQGEVNRKQKLDLWALGSPRPDIFDVPALAQEVILAFDMRPSSLLAEPESVGGGGALDALTGGGAPASQPGPGAGRGVREDALRAEPADDAGTDFTNRTGEPDLAALLSAAQRNGRG